MIIKSILTLIAVLSAGQAIAQDAALTEHPPKLNVFQRALPSLRPKNNFNPYATMKAPFADDTVASDGFDFISPRDETEKKMNDLQKNLDNSANAVPIHLPHAGLEVIRNWVLTATSQALTYTGDNANELKETLTYFTKDGQKSFLKFLKSKGIIGILKSQKYSVNTILKVQPLMINEAEAGGRYKWVFDIDTLTTYLPIKTNNYRQATARNDDFSLRVQVTRAPQAENPKDGLLIEIWQVKDK